MQKTLSANLTGKYIICSCEGTAEEVIMNILLDNECLIFSRSDLIDNKVTRHRTGAAIQREFLHKDYAKDVCIVRILDSKNENFKLDTLYRDRFPVYSIYTKPEIELLIIIAEHLYDDFLKHKSKQKPSDYLKNHLKKCNFKSKKFVEDYWQDVNKLVTAIQQYNAKHSSQNEYNIYHLLKH